MITIMDIDRGERDRTMFKELETVKYAANRVSRNADDFLLPCQVFSPTASLEII